MTEEEPPQRVEPLPVPRIPEGDELDDELRAELRMARELMAVREAQEGQGAPVALPAPLITRPRLACLSDEQLRDHIARLERDLSDVQRQIVKPQDFTLTGRLDYVEDHER